MSLINASASGNSLQKTSGCGGCPDASAVSEQQVTSGNGALEFVASETGTLRFIGLGAGGIGTQPGDITFAVRLQAGTAEVREAGAYRIETSFTTGDTFRITVEGGVVKYSKNGAVFHTSGTQATQALRVHAVLYDLNATLRDIVMRAASSASGSSNTSSPPPSPPSGDDRAQPRPGAGSTSAGTKRRR